MRCVFVFVSVYEEGYVLHAYHGPRKKWHSQVSRESKQELEEKTLLIRDAIMQHQMKYNLLVY